jgi:hypothetical protein
MIFRALWIFSAVAFFGSILAIITHALRGPIIVLPLLLSALAWYGAAFGMRCPRCRKSRLLKELIAPFYLVLIVPERDCSRCHLRFD